MPVIPASNPLSQYFHSTDYLNSGRSGEMDWTKYHRTYLQTFQVVVKVKGMGPLTVCGAPGMPEPFAPYHAPDGLEWDTDARATHFSAKLKFDVEGQWDVWLATVRYTTDWRGANPTLPDKPGFPSGGPQKKKGAATEPEDEPMEIEWDWEEVNVALRKDLDGKRFLNKAYLPFQQDPTFSYPCQVLVVSRNENYFRRATHKKWANALNSDVFMGENPDRCKCHPPRVRSSNRGSMAFWRVTYRIVFPPDLPEDVWADWQPQYLNAGTMRLQNDASKPNFAKAVPIYRQGHAVTAPVLLDENGQDAGTGSLFSQPEPVWIKFRVWRSYPFRDLFRKGLGSRV